MGSRAETLNRKRMRYGFGVGFEDYNRENIIKVRDLQAELMSNGDYIGYFDTYGGSLRVFLFDNESGRDKALKEAKQIGFTSAGKCEGVISVSNAEIKRPHLDNIRNSHAFYRELYR